MKVKIDVVDWKLIGACNLRCLHCYGPPKEEKALDKDSLFEIVDKYQSMGISWVVLTGGEPLMVKGIDEVMRRLKAAGIRIALSTNTTYFKHHQEVIEECVSSLNIPLDGSTAEIHALSRKDERTFKTFFDVLRRYQTHPGAKPSLLRVGTVYSKATIGDFVNMARLLEPYADVIDTWKVYELIDYEFQPELRKEIVHERGGFDKEMEELKANTSLASKIMLASAGSRDKAYFMVNPKAQVVIPTDRNGVTHELPVGDFLRMPLEEVVGRWQQHITGVNYNDNHHLHYGKLDQALSPTG
jgi:MoaA/NifB/PqqE/SkfB family radical SAM enzyme